MASSSETGHVKNVTNFESLITSAIAFGETYNPTRESIKLPALKALMGTAKTSLNALNIAQSNYSIAVAAREFAFLPFGTLITRVKNAIKATDTSTQIDESVETIVRKLQGRRAGSKITDEQKAALAAEGKESTQISVAQLSYDSKLENFDKLIMLLSSVPEYTPNELELNVDSLKAHYTELQSKNSDVLTASIQLSNARIARNNILYKPKTGLVDTAVDAKIYIKSVYGASSPQYRQISKLSFAVRS